MAKKTKAPAKKEVLKSKRPVPNGLTKGNPVKGELIEVGEIKIAPALAEKKSL